MFLVKFGFDDFSIGLWDFWRFQYTIDEIVKIQKEKENQNSLANI